MTEQNNFGDHPLEQMPIREKTEQKFPVVLVMDNSGSMASIGPGGMSGIEGVNHGIEGFKKKILADEVTSKQIEVALVTIGDGKVTVSHPFCSITDFNPPKLKPDGWTVLGDGILKAIELVTERKKMYRDEGIDYFRPWIFLITDATDCDMCYQKTTNPLFHEVSQKINDGLAKKSFKLFKIGTGEVDIEFLNKIPPENEAALLKDNKYEELFDWLSTSAFKLSRSNPAAVDSGQVSLPPINWSYN